MPILQSSTKDRLSAIRPGRGGWPWVLAVLFAIVPAGEASCQVRSLYDVASGNAPAGASDASLSVTATQVGGAESFALSIYVTPTDILENLQVVRGRETEHFEEWSVNFEMDRIDLEASTTSTSIVAPAGRPAEIAVLRFDVSASAPSGATVAMVLDRVSHSLPFEILADLGLFRVGEETVPERSRRLDLEFEPDHGFPGDLVMLNLYIEQVPNLYSGQVFFEYPSQALHREGAIGGDLVESLGWSAAYSSPTPNAPNPSVIVDRLFGQRPAPGLGRFRLASIPFRVGPDWGDSSYAFQARALEGLLLGDILSRGDNLYHFTSSGVDLRQSPPDLNEDGVVDEKDLLEFQRHWREGGETE